MADPKVKLVRDIGKDVIDTVKRQTGTLTKAETELVADTAAQVGEGNAVEASVRAVLDSRGADLEGMPQFRETVKGMADKARPAANPDLDLEGMPQFRTAVQSAKGTPSGVGGPTSSATPTTLKTSDPMNPGALSLEVVDPEKAAKAGFSAKTKLAAGTVVGGAGLAAALGSRDSTAPATTEDTPPPPLPAPKATPTPETPAPDPLDLEIEATSKKFLKGVRLDTAAYAGFAEPAPQFVNSTVEIADAETGEPREVQVKEAVQYYAAQQAKELVALKEEYRAEKESARSAALWAEIIRGVAAMAAGAYGMKHGVDMSGVKFDPIDWIARQRAAREGYETEANMTGAKYKALQEAAKETSVADKEDYQAALQQYQVKYTGWKSAVEAANAKNQVTLDNARLSNDALRFKLDSLQFIKQTQLKEAELAISAAAKLGTSAADVKKELAQIRGDFLAALNKATVAGAKKDGQGEARLSMGAAFELDQRYKALTGRPIVPETQWTKEESQYFGLSKATVPSTPEEVGAAAYPVPGEATDSPEPRDAGTMIQITKRDPATGKDVFASVPKGTPLAEGWKPVPWGAK